MVNNLQEIGLAIAKAQRRCTFVVGSSKSTPSNRSYHLIERSGHPASITTYIGLKGGGQGGGRTSQGVLKLNLGRTRHLGPCGGDATPIELDFDLDSAAGSHRFCNISTLRRNLKVKPIALETRRDKLSPQKRITQFGVRM